ncbi:hypothetical protein DFH07DRAFT_954268 [Mycena maculata]|uniref:Uncharacterized protein n=1 Tax=Mycena maculata TaxID=230809 RepID=A0AAD7JT41_9AGAR|nr:hypothetical protein DFH07DRAFT_954268 [Mycena maculata]
MSAASSSYANLNVIAILDKPRKLPEDKLPKTTFLDVYVYIGPTDSDTILGCVHYFSNVSTPFEPGLYHCIIMLAQNHKKLDNCEEEPVKHEDYAFVGDLKSCSPVESANVQCGYMHISGAVVKSDHPRAPFEMDVEQYTGAYADLAKSGLPAPAPVSVLPVLGYFPDSPWYRKAKSVPKVNKLVMFGGYLTGISEVLGDAGVTKRFCIEVDSIAFLGFLNTPTATPAAASPLVAMATGGSICEYINQSQEPLLIVFSVTQLQQIPKQQAGKDVGFRASYEQPSTVDVPDLICRI